LVMSSFLVYESESQNSAASNEKVWMEVAAQKNSREGGP
jgi:hypothetical protein